MARTTTITLLALLLCGLNVAHAGNPPINSQIFKPAPHPGDLFTVLGSEVGEKHRWSVSLMGNYGNNPMVFIDQSAEPERTHRIIEHQLTLDLMGSYSIMGWVDVGIAIPVRLWNAGDETGFVEHDAIPGAALEDIRLSPRVKILNRDQDADGLGVAFEVLFGLPTGDPNAFASDGFHVVPTAIVDFKTGIVTLAANLGWKIRSEEEFSFLNVDDEFLFRVGAGFEVMPRELTVIGEIYGATSDFTARNSSNMEGVAGVRYLLEHPGLTFTLGGGTGFLKGYGNTRFRVFAGIGYLPPVSHDTDGDGIEDEVDRCPNDPEDFDEFEDEDGCPDTDNDNDGIFDKDDKCPNEAEDRDGFEDADGCPDLDNDQDGVPDSSDQCPMDPEDRDKWKDEDGCPDPDNDADRIPDVKDKCPNEAEVYNGVDDEDGCPDKTLAVRQKEKIAIYDKVYFETGKARILPRGIEVLKAVRDVIKANPDIKKIIIEGHTDDRDDDKFNMWLSDLRAKAVRQWLIDNGIAADMLEAIGYGETRPAVPNDSPENRQKNRRVEFIIKAQ